MPSRAPLPSRTGALRRPVPAAAVLLPALLLAAGCDVPRFEGAQIQSPPPGFTLNHDATLERRIFPDRPVVAHDTWVRAHWGDFNGIYINAHAGSTTPEEVEGAWQASQASPAVRWDEVREVGGIERLTIDGREARGWLETVRGPSDGIAWVIYRAVVPYDTVSYTVEFLSGDPAFKSNSDSLRAIVASFGIGRVRYNVPLILVAAGALLFLLAQQRARSRDRRLRARAMVLPRIERKEGGDAAADPAGVGPGGAGPGPPTRSDPS